MAKKKIVIHKPSDRECLEFLNVFIQTQELIPPDVTEFAVDLIKKATPTEPERIRVSDYGWFYTAKCPGCGRLVTSSERYCKRCGQSLDWEAFDKSYKERKRKQHE